MIPQGYRFLRIERADIQKGNEKGNQAVQLMGTLPDEILSGEHRAPLAPTQRHMSSGFSRKLELHPTSSAPGAAQVISENDDT